MTTLLIGLIALALMVPVGDRMRQMNFKTHRCPVVVLYLAAALTCLWSAWTFLFDGGTSYWSAVGLVLVFLLLINTRPTWKNGPPEHTTRPMETTHEDRGPNRGKAH
jgi:hypothetical protein